MNEDTEPTTLHLIVRRTIKARPARLFEAWTNAAQLSQWWGPKGVRCSHAEIDARVGGKYRIGNEMPDGQVVWIEGELLQFEPPVRLVYTWNVTQQDASIAQGEIVTVRFEARGDETEVIVVHERIADVKVRDTHAIGWEGCLAGLASFV